MLSDKEITEGIASHSSSAISYVYEEMFPYVEAYVVHHGGSSDQAKDIFQEAMIIVYKKIMAGKFTLHCKFSTYLYAVSKRIWIQDIKKQYFRINKLQEISHLAEPEVDYGQETVDEARDLLDKYFKKISPDCQKILLMHFNGIQLEEIRKEMGISTVHNAADKKFRCKKNLIDRLKEDPLFIKLKNE